MKKRVVIIKIISCTLVILVITFILPNGKLPSSNQKEEMMKSDSKDVIQDTEIDKVVKDSSIDIESDEPYSQFKLGYWNSKKFATIEGQVRMEGQLFGTNDSVEKYVEIVDESKKVISSTKAINTNWYDEKNYDGYQVQLGENELGNLTTGEYSLQVKSVFEGTEYTVPIKQMGVLSEKDSTDNIGINSYSETITGINSYTIGKKFIDFSNRDGTCVMHISERKKGINKIVQYRGKGESRIYDGWINTNYDFKKKHKKELLIEDRNGKEIFNKDVGTWDIKVNYQLDVEESLDKSGFQVVIPAKYTGDSYQKFVVIKEDGKEKGKYELKDSEY